VKSENRYTIGKVICFITFYDETGNCDVRIENQLFKYIPIELIELIAEPAP